MENKDLRPHWEKVYATKNSDEVSWYQDVPATSLELISHISLPKNAAIIDVGGGDSRLAENLLALGYTDITVLDISEKALQRAKERLGEKANRVQWVVADISRWVPGRQYDLWHDRAVFHFMTTEEQIRHYLEIAGRHLKPGGHLLIGTFSEKGPEKCSGLPVKRYSEATLYQLLQVDFEKIKCREEDHITPFATKQNFLFCNFKRLAA